MTARSRLAVLAGAATGSVVTAVVMTLGQPTQPAESPGEATALLANGRPIRTTWHPHPPGTTTTTTAPATTTTTLLPTTTSTPPPTTTTVAPTTTKPAPTTTKSTTTPVVVPGASPAESAVLDLVNARRAEAGCKPLRWNDKLATAAREHSQDMAVNNYFDHTSLDGRSPFDRMAAAGYPHGGGENIAAGQTTPDAVMTSWMNSAGHRANILNCSFVDIGVGMYRGGSYRVYWTQAFGFA
ncbi:CAP domain-containing protein [Actinokineospora enzanensis]|uniref:CAP domain-containing protein n=1 Tax=Actinokineospora enzanensis TaxID=155975 RepID=UPI0003688913|nr:CAP domain-containing protein [Actinokineospora enzanensis]